MKRIMAIWLPNWPIQRLISIRPELKQQPVILHHQGRRGQCVVACCDTAWQLGVRMDMTASEAAALVQPSLNHKDHQKELHLDQHDQAADCRGLQQLAHWCQRFSPLVGVEEADRPETLLLDVTGLASLFGGERSLVWQVASEMKQRSLAIHAGLAHTIGAAWALAHYGARAVTTEIAAAADVDSPLNLAARTDPISPPTEVDGKTLILQSCPPMINELPRFPDLLQRLPVQALRLPEETVQLLHRLGIEHLAHLQALPRDSLSSRFGPLLLRRLDQALGTAPEIIRPSHRPRELIVNWSLEYPTQQRDLLDQIIEHLIHRLTLLLAKQGVGALHMVCRLQFQSAPPLSRQVGLFQPSARPRHLCQLLQSSLEQVRLPAPVTDIRIQVTRSGPHATQQLDLFDEDRSAAQRRSSAELAILVDRLTARLGHRAVSKPQLRSEAQPELAYQLDTHGHDTDGPRRMPKRGFSTGNAPFAIPIENPLDRPLSLLNRPAPLRVTAVVPDGSPVRFWFEQRQHQVVRYVGPERIETGWHRRRGIRRDYYQVETTDGQRFWLFREINNHRWFLHGKFA